MGIALTTLEKFLNKSLFSDPKSHQTKTKKQEKKKPIACNVRTYKSKNGNELKSLSPWKSSSGERKIIKRSTRVHSTNDRKKGTLRMY